MAAPVKPGTPARYWREVEGLSRLEIALLRDPELTDEERGPLVAAIDDLKDKLVKVAGQGERALPALEESGESQAPDAPAARAV